MTVRPVALFRDDAEAAAEGLELGFFPVEVDADRGFEGEPAGVGIGWGEDQFGDGLLEVAFAAELALAAGDAELARADGCALGGSEGSFERDRGRLFAVEQADGDGGFCLPVGEGVAHGEVPIVAGGS